MWKRGYRFIVLLEEGAHPTITNNNGKTPLHDASQQGHESIVSLLLVKGADANIKDKDGYTPLHDAFRSGKV
jgi:ankyrin repeat protein